MQVASSSQATLTQTRVDAVRATHSSTNPIAVAAQQASSSGMNVVASNIAEQPMTRAVSVPNIPQQIPIRPKREYQFLRLVIRFIRKRLET